MVCYGFNDSVGKISIRQLHLFFEYRTNMWNDATVKCAKLHAKETKVTCNTYTKCFGVGKAKHTVSSEKYAVLPSLTKRH
jgi:hypothetical protein